MDEGNEEKEVEGFFRDVLEKDNRRREKDVV